MPHLRPVRPHHVTKEKSGIHRYQVEAREATYLVTALPLPPPPPQEYYAKDGESFQFIAYKFLKNPDAVVGDR